MAGKRSAEGIALLFAYGDVDSDNELDDSPASSPTAPSAPAGEAPGSIVDYAHDEAAATPEHKVLLPPLLCHCLLRDNNQGQITLKTPSVSER